MQSGQKKLYWEKEKKREKEGKKREKDKRKKKMKKEKKKRKKKKERNKGWGMQTNQKEIKEKKRKEKKEKKRKGKKRKSHGEYLLILYTLSLLTSPGTGPSSWSSGGEACCSDFQVLALEGAALPSAWCRAQWGLFNP